MCSKHIQSKRHYYFPHFSIWSKKAMSPLARTLMHLGIIPPTKEVAKEIEDRQVEQLKAVIGLSVFFGYIKIPTNF